MNTAELYSPLISRFDSVQHGYIATLKDDNKAIIAVLGKLQDGTLALMQDQDNALFAKEKHKIERAIAEYEKSNPVGLEISPAILAQSRE